MANHVYSQGEFDGACFLYSIANAYKALCRGRPGIRMWKNALKSVPFKEDFIVGAVGTHRYDNNMALYIHAIERMLTVFSRERYTLTVAAREGLTINDLYELLNENSVLICCFNGEHWSVAVDIDDKHIYLADSSKLIEDRLSYYEEKSPNYNRYYNDMKTLKPFNWLFNRSALQIVAE